MTLNRILKSRVGLPPLLFALSAPLHLLKPLVLLISTLSHTVPHNTGVAVQVLEFQLDLLLSKHVPVLPQVALLMLPPLKPLVLLTAIKSLVLIATLSLTLPQNTGG